MGEIKEEVGYKAVALAAQTTSEKNEEPTNIKEAFQWPNESHWRDAVEKELEALKINHNWDEVVRPSKNNIVGSRWFLKVKRNVDGSTDTY